MAWWWLSSRAQHTAARAVSCCCHHTQQSRWAGPPHLTSSHPIPPLHTPEATAQHRSCQASPPPPHPSILPPEAAAQDHLAGDAVGRAQATAARAAGVCITQHQPLGAAPCQRHHLRRSDGWREREGWRRCVSGRSGAVLPCAGGRPAHPTGRMHALFVYTASARHPPSWPHPSTRTHPHPMTTSPCPTTNGI